MAPHGSSARAARFAGKSERSPAGAVLVSFPAGRVEVPLLGDVQQSRDIEEGVVVIARQSTCDGLREHAFGGVLIDLALYPVGKPVDFVPEPGNDLIAGQRVQARYGVAESADG